VLGVERAFVSPERRSRVGPLLVLSYIGVLSHVALDWLNNYGVRLLMPISGRWFYGDSVFIVDPWLWLVLGGGVWLARRRGRKAAAAAAIVASGFYIAGMVWSARAARQDVIEAWTRQHHRPPQALMVGPVLANPLQRRVVVDAGDAYYTGSFHWFPTRLALDGPTVPRRDDDPAVLRARAHPEIRAVLSWARFPYYEITPVAEGVRVTLRDMRFGAQVGEVSVIVSP
jgi:inner membrane protein